MSITETIQDEKNLLDRIEEEIPKVLLRGDDNEIEMYKSLVDSFHSKIMFQYRFKYPEEARREINARVSNILNKLYENA